jgi:hypothetical protein
MFDVFASYVDTFSKSFRNACAFSLAKLPVAINVTESVFDVKRQFIKRYWFSGRKQNLSTPPPPEEEL